MAKINFGNSVMEEFEKIALDKGWITKQAEDNATQDQELLEKLKNVLGLSNSTSVSDTINHFEKKYMEVFQKFPDINNIDNEITLLLNKIGQQSVNVTEQQTTPEQQTTSEQKTTSKQKVTPKRRRYQRSDLIGQVQDALQTAGYYNSKIDKIWGPNTAKAWNKAFKDYGPAYFVNENGHQLPSSNLLKYVATKWIKSNQKETPETVDKSNMPVLPRPQTTDVRASLKNANLKLSPEQESIVKSVMNLRHVDFETALEFAKNRYPTIFRKPNMYDDWAENMPKLSPEDTKMINTDKITEESLEKMNAFHRNITASVVNELVSLANDLEEMGERKMAIAVDKQLRLYKNASDKLYDVIGETGEQLINMAHPGGGLTVVPAKDEGGKVETVVEEHKKILDKINKQPTGKIAEVIKKLIVTANQLENDGEIETAKLVDKTIKEIRRASFPFVGRSIVSDTTYSNDNKVSIKTAAEVTKEMLKIKLEELYRETSKLRYEINYSKTWAKETFKNFLDFSVSVKHLSDRFDEIIYNINVMLVDFDKYIKNIDEITKFYEKFVYGIYKKVMEDYGIEFDKYLHPLFEKIKAYSTLLNNFKNQQNQRGTKQDKKGKKGKTNRQTLINNYKGTLETLQKVLYNHPKAAGRILGEKDINSWKVTVLKELNGRNKMTDEDLSESNELVWNDILKKLPTRTKKIIGIASVKENSINKNSGLVSEKIKSIQPKTQAPTSRKTRRSPGTPQGKRDSDVESLQQALLDIGLDPGGKDGIWGPKTAGAYNKMIETYPSAENYMKPVDVATTNHSNRPINDIKKAIKFANFIRSRNQTSANTITVDNIKFSLNEMTSPKIFMQSLANKLNKKITVQDAMSYVEKISKYLDSNSEDMNMNNPESLTNWQNAVNTLNSQLLSGQAQAPGQAPEQTQAPGQAQGQIKVPMFKGIINSREDLQSAIDSLVPINYLNKESIDAFARSEGMNVPKYLRELNNLVGDLKVSSYKLKDQIQGGNENIMNFLNKYHGYVTTLASDLNITLTRNYS